jgi:hypothetical protein
MKRFLTPALAPLYYLGLLLGTGCVAGCLGERQADKEARALSQCEVLAEKLSQEVGEDGWFKHGGTDETDPWGSPLEVKYRRTGGTETLIVWSNGPDKLPHTKDDIASHAYHLDNATALAEIAELKSKRRQAAVENYGASLTRGLVRGGHEGWQDRSRKNDTGRPKDPPKDDKDKK